MFGFVLAGVLVGTQSREPGRLPAPPPVVMRFHSRPDLRPPIIEVQRRAAGRAPGYIFVAPKIGADQTGPMIADDRGRLVWFHHVAPGLRAYDFRAQTYRGKPVLTWWQGRFADGHGSGVGVIADTSYRQIAEVRAVGDYANDLHEFQLTSRGTALITVYRPVSRDLTAIGGPARATVMDSIVQEVDIRTGQRVFEWHSLGHVGLGESYARVPATDGDQFDYFHVNSIDEERNGDLLISARNTRALYEIDRRTGRVQWRLGGKRSDFAMGPGADFLGQHDARRLGDGDIALFDNGFPPLPDRESRVIVLRVDQRKKAARLVRSYKHPSAPHSHSQGSEQALANGNLFAGWGGDSPYFSEFSPDGRLLFDARFAPPRTTTYRAYRMPWRARPAESPRAAATVDGGRMTVYASWNGATDVAAWRLLVGHDAASLEPVGVTPRSGFETSMRTRRAPYVAVEALDRAGAVLPGP
jgi:hypothetical protein